jgi:hypothetical protein
MYIQEFSKLPDESRLFLYRASQKLNNEQEIILQKELSLFLDSWQAHQKDLYASFKIDFQRLVLVGVDQNKEMASGCSIDSLVHFFKNLENKIGISFFDTSFFVSPSDNLSQIITYKNTQTLKEDIENKKISVDDFIYNFGVQTLKDWKEKGKITFEKHLFAKYFLSEKIN